MESPIANKNYSSPEELISDAKANGINITIEDLATLKARLLSSNSDLSPESLEEVQGGGAKAKAGKGILEDVLGFDLGIHLF